MGLLDSIRRLFGRAEDAMNEVDYAALDAVHHAQDRVDEATGGRYYDTVEKADDEAGELLERLHLDEEPEPRTGPPETVDGAADGAGAGAQDAADGPPGPSAA
jgi:hypothetical protein